MEREVGGTEPQPVLGRMVAIEDYILCRFLPPLSEFLLLVLNFYSLSLLHLNPNSIAFLSIFAHLCETYIGVEPFLDLFCFYYELRWMESNRVSGCVGFRLRDGLKSRYIPFQCPSSRSKWRARWFYLQIENSDFIFVVPEEQPDKILSWTAKPTLTPALRSFVKAIDDLRVRGLSGYEVAADFVGLNSKTVERCVGQLMISGPTMAGDIPVPLCEKEATEREAVINALPLTDVIGPLVDHQAAASLKERVVQETSDAATAVAASSGSRPQRRGRKFTSVLASDASPPPPRRQKLVTLGEKWARAKAAQDGSGETSSASPAVASTDVVVAPRSRKATPHCLAGDLGPVRGPPADVLSRGELQVEMGRLLEAGARGISREIAEARTAAAASANKRADKLERKLAEVREDLQKMRELVAGNERQRRGLEGRMAELESNLSELRGLLRVTYTGLHQLAGECGVKTTIPVNPDKFSLTSLLEELATAMEAISSKHTARIGEEASNGIYTGACHVLACVRDVDVEDVQQRGQPVAPAIIPALAFEAHASPDDVDEILPSTTGVATTSLDLESALTDQDRRIQYWKTKFEVAKLERTMLEVKKEQAVETLRGHEVWFNSYLKSCCTSMAEICRELRVPRGNPEESAAGYISWLNGACTQLEGVVKRIDGALKQECRRSSRYVGGHVLACIRDHRPNCTSSFSMKGSLVLGGLQRR
uniref:OSIGBa0104J13.7 protein n=1 Tax=Oryza sativa TaxID=4530 RepID=Q01LL8_ORYSA|nr:OSIGBa0104J13.7 [Oryza sativa]